MIIDITKPENTINFAKTFSKKVTPGVPILLHGGLGVGKTFFTTHLIRSLIKEDIDVPSPTFSLLQIYKIRNIEIFHYDFYRVNDPEELYELDIDNALNNAVSIIEWPEIIENYINKNFKPIHLYFSFINNFRKIEIIE